MSISQSTLPECFAEHQRCYGTRTPLVHVCRGYSTAEDVAAVAAQQRVKSITLAQFQELLKWGVVMGVDDGCEPEPEEVQAMIADTNARP